MTKYQVIARHNGSETRLPELWEFMSLAEVRAEQLRNDGEYYLSHGVVEVLVVAVEAADEGRA